MNMKISVKALIENKACYLGIWDYINADLEEVDLENKIITVYNTDDFENLKWLADRFKIKNLIIKNR